MARKREYVPEPTVYRDVAATFLECRDLRHAWATSADFSVEVKRVRSRRMKVYTRVLACQRCGVVRTDYFDEYLDRVALNYDYPDGYQVSRGADGLRGAKAVRVEVLVRGGLL